VAEGFAVVAKSEFEDREAGVHETGAGAHSAIRYARRSFLRDRTCLGLLAAPGRHRQIRKTALTGMHRHPDPSSALPAPCYRPA
jgi:hypothetical protein